MALPDETDVEAHVDRAAALVDLKIAPEFRPGVVTNFRRTAEIAALVVEFPLPDDAESAPTFRP